MKPKPYIGITGPVTIEEVDYLLHEFSSAGYFPHTPHAPMVGFLVSQKTLNGEPTKNRRYPEVKNLKSLVERTKGRALPMVHYNTRENSDLSEQLTTLFRELYDEDICRAVQLNIAKPSLEQLKLTKEKMPELNVVFQVSCGIMSNSSPREIAEKVSEYGTTIDYALIDPSGGKGAEFEIDKSVNIYKEIREKAPDVTIGFAGGFTGRNVASRVEELISKTGARDFCIDAEGGLRDKITSAYGDDVLNTGKVSWYLREASGVLR